MICRCADSGIVADGFGVTVNTAKIGADNCSVVDVSCVFAGQCATGGVSVATDAGERSAPLGDWRVGDDTAAAVAATGGTAFVTGQITEGIAAPLNNIDRTADMGAAGDNCCACCRSGTVTALAGNCANGSMFFVTVCG